METRAAVAWEAGKPLSIETIRLEGPKAGEVLVEVMATGVCHTDAYTLSGLDSRPTTVAWGQRSTSSAGRLPGPQPRSTTLPGASAPTRPTERSLV